MRKPPKPKVAFLILPTVRAVSCNLPIWGDLIRADGAGGYCQFPGDYVRGGRGL